MKRWMLLIVAAGLAGCGEKGGPSEALEKVEGWGSVDELYETGCADCHGAKGEGNNPKVVPAIAGLPDYYVVGELTKFRALMRGKEPNAAGGSLKMHGIASAMTPELTEGLGAYVAAMPPVASELTTAEGADIERGGELYRAQCAECHGPNAEGDPAKMSPPLYVFQDWYLAAQIEKFQVEYRKADPANEASQRMHATALTMVLEEDVRDVTGFIVSQLEGSGDAEP